MKLEESLERVVESADDVFRTAKDVVKEARKLRTAALAGKIRVLNGQPDVVAEAQGRLELAVSTLIRSAADATAWPATGDSEGRGWSESYLAELREAASAANLEARERDGQLLCFPSIVRPRLGEPVISINQKRVDQVRPSKVVRILGQNLRKSQQSNSTQFFRALHFLYHDLTDQRPATLPFNSPPIGLGQMFKHLTSHPQFRREYKKEDFARDLYALEHNGPSHLRVGKRTFEIILAPPSTGSRQPAGIFSFIGPDGREAKYFTVRFRHAD